MNTFVPCRHWWVMLVVLCPARSWADSWLQATQQEYWSQHRTAVLRVTPDEKPQDRPGHCLAELFQIDNGTRKLAWSRSLINNIAPVYAVVADSGEYVVTFDEWEHIGTFPLVIYGPKGQLVTVHRFESLGKLFEGSRGRLMGSCSGIEWLQQSLIFFGPGDETLFIRLFWNKILVFQLADGGLINEKWYERNSWRYTKDELDSLYAFGDKRIRELAMEHLKSAKARDRETGALIAQQLRLREAIPRLRELLSDPSTYEWYRGDGPKHKVFYIRKAAKEALEAMGEKVEGVDIGEPDSSE